MLDTEHYIVEKHTKTFMFLIPLITVIVFLFACLFSFVLNIVHKFYYSTIPYISVPFDIQVVEVVCVFQLACFGTLQPLNDLCFHFHGNVSRQ